MTYKALVIEADPKSIESVNIALDSLEHTSDVVHSQAEAMKRLKQNEYSYIICDIRIPARDGKADSRIQNTENLLDKMSQMPDQPMPPIILMSDYIAEGNEGTVDAMRLAMTMGRKGVVDIIDKNFPGQGCTLDRVIKKVLSQTHSHKKSRLGREVAVKMDSEKNHDETSSQAIKGIQPANESATNNSVLPRTVDGPPQPFEKGQMVLYEDRVELCGVKICGASDSGIKRGILDTLSQTNSQGRLLQLSGGEMAKRLDCERGQNGIAEAIREQRIYTRDVMLEQANIKMNHLRDFIINDRRYGYCLSPKITVRQVKAYVYVPQSKGHVPLNVPVNENDDPENNERQRWAIEQLNVKGEFRKAQLIEKFCCANKTAERDLRDLHRRGWIEFIGPAKTGYWQQVAEG